ncbi:UNKNOWN [Stylonychia lemnae]|uniref:Uncharacterized protein n=1 Tax=Stylonychia lemnae TaxID=5949 RepID=A0A078A921_STYLE|nr:UNKNOWN [Stylonychia lemnae]|eukprot:CDW78052.1 UNKNOWN [Stylonychia lemnae]
MSATTSGTASQSPGSAPRRKKKGSMYSLASSARRARPMMKEELIGKKINDLFKEKEMKMIRGIETAIFEDNHRIYTEKRSQYAAQLDELEKERGRITRRKKNKKDKLKQLRQNIKLKMQYITKALNETVKYYKSLYYENDYYRQKRVMELDEVVEMDEEQKKENKLKQMNDFFQSPFKDDKRFAITYISQLTRDKLYGHFIYLTLFRQESDTIVNQIFFDKIFNLLLETDDERNKLKSFEILCNLIHSDIQRKKLAEQNYFQRVYDGFNQPKLDNRTMEKLSWMTTLICFYPDMIDQIIKLNLLEFIIKISGYQYQSNIRSNAVLALSLLTYHEKMFDELISRGVIDLVMDLCKDSNGDIQVKQFSTLALVHFALNKQSISILIDKGVMDLFNSFASIDNGIIQTNVSWIFLALCNNGITGKTMLENGITRDMFLVSCNPQFNQIRHLVIAGFAELGRCTELKDVDERLLSAEMQKIKETAIVGMHRNFKENLTKQYHIGHQRTISYQIMRISQKILMVSFRHSSMVVFILKKMLIDQSNFILDALMHLTGSTSKFIRTRAFSTLSTLSTYASSSQNIMDQISRDIKLPSNKTSKMYYDFISARLKNNLQQFDGLYKTHEIESKYAGLYCLLRIAKDPKEEVINEAADQLYQFIFSGKVAQKDGLNEAFFIYVFHALKFSKDHIILLKILKVIKFYIKHNSPMQKEVINPDTILWLLEILEQHKSKKLLGCKASRTLLQIVSEHQIVFDYQEVAIIKKFNLALQNLDVFDSQQDQEENQEILTQIMSSQNVQNTQQTQNEGKTSQQKIEEPQSSIEEPLNPYEMNEQQLQLILDNDGEVKSRKSHQIIIQNEDLKIETNSNMTKSFNQDDQKSNQDKMSQKSAQNLVEIDRASSKSQSMSQQQNKHDLGQVLSEKSILSMQQQQNVNGNDRLSNKKSVDAQNQQEVQSQLQKLNEMTQNSKNATQDLEQNKSFVSANQSMSQESNINNDSAFLKAQQKLKENQKNVSKMQTLRDSLIQSKKTVTKGKKPRMSILQGNLNFSVDSNGQPKNIEQNDNIYGEDEDTESDESFLSTQDDAVLDQYLRDSLIKSFMERMLSKEVILGITHLLELSDEQDIIKNTVKACTYLSMNYEFVSSKLSLDVLKNLMPLLTIFQGDDKLHLIYSISNILKGDNDNKMFFFEKDGSSMFLRLILDTQDEKLIEICTSSLKELGSFKKTIQGIIIKDEELIKRVFAKCLEITDQWKENQIVHRKQIKESRKNLDDDPYQQSDNIFSEGALNSQNSGRGNMNDRGFKDHNLMQKLIKNDGDEKKSSLFASSCAQIRNSIYYAIAKSIKRGLSVAYLRDQCHLLDRIINDLHDYEENWFIFENVLLALNAFEIEPTIIYELLNSKYEMIFQLIQTYPIKDNRISLLKVIINLILRSMEILSKNVNLFKQLFELISYQKDLEVQENVIWLVSAMIDQSSSQNIIRNVLQTLKTLTTMTKINEFLDQFKSLDLFSRLQLITQAPYLVNQGFLHIMINEINNNNYLIDNQYHGQDLLDIDEDFQDLSYGKMPNEKLLKIAEQLNLKNLTQGGLINLDDDFFEDIDKINNSNQLIEEIIGTIANISAFNDSHSQLIDLGLLDKFKNILGLFCPFQYQLGYRVQQNQEQVELTAMSLGNIKILKSISQTIYNLTLNTEFQETLVKKDIVLIMRHEGCINDYDLLTNLYMSFGNLILSKSDHIKKRAVELGCLEHLMDVNESTQYLRIRRICNQILQKTDAQLFEYNDQIKSNY